MELALCEWERDILESSNKEVWEGTRRMVFLWSKGAVRYKVVESDQESLAPRIPIKKSFGTLLAVDIPLW